MSYTVVGTSGWLLTYWPAILFIYILHYFYIQLKKCNEVALSLWMQIAVSVLLSENLITYMVASLGERIRKTGWRERAGRSSHKFSHSLSALIRTARRTQGPNLHPFYSSTQHILTRPWLNVISHSIKWKLLKYSADRVGRRCASGTFPFGKHTHTHGRVRAGAKLCTR